MHILIVEDDRKTAELLTTVLEREGFVVSHAVDGETGLQRALSGSFDALVVDIMLPRLDGLGVVRTLRHQGKTAPIIMLSARGEVDQRVEGLNAGADDYLPKPFATSELLARLNSLLRRLTTFKPTMLTQGDLTYDTATRETRKAGRRIDLSTRESLLLECLLRAEGNVVSRRDIIRTVWEYDFDPGTNLVDVYVKRLREKVDRGSAFPLILTIRGLGYALRSQSKP